MAFLVSGNSKEMVFKAKILARVQKHPYLYVVKISRDSGDLLNHKYGESG